MFIAKLLNASSRFLNLLDEIEENEGVIDTTLETDFDTAVREMAEITDEFANSMEYLDRSIDAVRARKQYFEQKLRRLESYKQMARDHAKSLLMLGVEFQSENRKVSLVPYTRYDLDGVIIEDIPREFIKVERSILKKDLINAIKRGEIEPPDGFREVKDYTLRVS